MWSFMANHRPKNRPKNPPQSPARRASGAVQGASRGDIEAQTLRRLRQYEGRYPQMPRMAEMLGFSPRSYRRWLALEHTSFQRLLDQVRSEQATYYLQNTDLPLVSIAYSVGFNDVSNFRRAYMRWSGRSPGDVRHGA